MKTGKEIKSSIFNDFNVIFGSVNNKNPKSVYLNVSAWSQPKEDCDGNYNRAIRNLIKKIKQTLFNYSSNLNLNKEMTIVDLDLRESGIRKGKRSFMSCEVTFYLNVEIPVNSEEMKTNLNNVAQELIDKVFEQCDTFDFYKRKR
jgi:hypothetical protein